MTRWLDRKERILRHTQYVNWRLAGSPKLTGVDWIPPRLDMCRELSLAKHPSVHAISLQTIQNHYNAPFFTVALRRFISCSNKPNQTRAQLERSLWNAQLPFTKLPVWHVIKFLRSDPLTGDRLTADSLHAQPSRSDKRGCPIPGRFDTALINDGTGGDHGSNGIFSMSLSASVSS
jgi:hypothetical protein